MAPHVLTGRKTATIKDVAERAAVSTATVSYVVNKSRFVSPELTGRVLEAVRELKFTPSRLGRNLRQGRTSTVGLITDDITNRFSAEFIGGLEEAATRNQYAVIISDLHDEPGNEERSISLLVDQKVDGIIYAGFGSAESRLEELYAGGMPIVVADKPPVSEALPAVLIDNRGSVFEALRHLERLGHRRIVFINGLEINRNAQLRSRAFRDFLVRRRMPFSENSILYGDYTLDHGFQAASWLLDEKVPCSAIFCGDDVIAFGVMAALKSRGRRIPQDTAVVGFDDDPLARVMDPSLTTVHYPMREMGRMSFRLFLKLRSARRRHPHRVLLETRLVVRRSTDPRHRQYRDLDVDMAGTAGTSDLGDGGLRGSRGDKGRRGKRGNRGSRGRRGRRGNRGSKGDRGSRGNRGSKGSRGSRGSRGEVLSSTAPPRPGRGRPAARRGRSPTRRKRSPGRAGRSPAQGRRPPAPRRRSPAGGRRLPARTARPGARCRK